ncbi:YD repeat-containing protein [Tamaricihabitans halophyticus]|uniref:YD repeat-containing protein n=1 Tax=Tamaricihabitans halophyticus TaxID=1262583 RepID=A0A4R2QJ41_9PSEU|nr:PQQ-binding-like beta-propeller repeat protein [Tamaricihabitans halophyticus]TCP49277.1 YD repeat-containing protein [Tamaricihabitans halophyticus]
MAPRHPFRRRRDFVIAGALAVLTVLGGTLVWLDSDYRATTSQVANSAPDPAAVEQPDSVPPTVAEVWRAPSPGTPEPVVAGPGVVTATDNAVVGRDPLTGAQRWRYARDIPLCTVAAAGSDVIAAHRKSVAREDDRCGEITALDPATGERVAQRNADTEVGTRLLFDGGHITATGKRVLYTWRQDLVQSMEYGEIPAQVNPQRQPRQGCVFGTVAVDDGRIGVVGRCPNDSGDRLSLYRATSGADNDDDAPVELFSVIVGNRQHGQLVAVSDERSAVALPAEDALVVFDDEGRRIAEHSLDGDTTALERDPAGRAVAARSSTTAVQWFTGSQVISLAKPDLTPQWTLDGARGLGTEFAGRTLVPVDDGIAVLDQRSGERLGTLQVDRGDYTGDVTVDSVGSVLIEQRGDTIVALR